MRSGARRPTPHADLDLVIAGEQCAAAQAAIGRLGFRCDATTAPGLPARLVLRAPGRPQVDVHPARFDEAGDGWQDLGGGRRGRYTAAGLAGQGVLASQRVRCLTADPQLRHHQGYEPDRDGLRDIALLRRLLEGERANGA